ncbi:DHH family phosphoesterase [Haliovirga abyssi]|uniref:MGPA protein n=1 Tax=Haliovirga abyssi TaxID=2996794 RepID=A0AAU9DCE6_9FUSO|nr:bifunctional oligoribonuclease/PAP phosphatase NrnA [Haliovirga abyssi]BDU50980.1 MGPA protein [Haliovirga abyssi]
MESIIKKLKESKRILITTHVNPDGDGIGAGLALALALNKINSNEDKMVRFIIQDDVPSFLRFLPHSVLIEKVENVELKYDFDCIVVVDVANKERIGTVVKYINENSIVINIDHHTSNEMFGELNYLDAKASSVAEIIFNLITKLEIAIDKDMGEAIYCGIINDTGNFSYNNVSVDTFNIAAKLKAIGVDNEKVTENLYANKSEARLKILGLALNNMEYFEKEKLSFFYLSNKVLKEYNAKSEDTEGIVESLRSFEKCEIALFLKEEEDGKIKGSFRSKGKDVNKLAAIFDGGGHVKAAGFKTSLDKEEILKRVLEKL